MKRLGLFVAGCILVLGSVGASYGGWAVVSFENPPEHIIVGQPIGLTFTVRQHGVTPLAGLNPRIEARSGWRVVHGSAWSAPKPGAYRARITVPGPGQWQIIVQSGFGRSRGQLLAMRAVDSGSKVAKLDDAERGRFVFAAKGCVTCHVHRAVDITGELASHGPDLSDRRFPSDYLARFLANPAIKPQTSGSARMPNLELGPREITALVAFINAERTLSAR